MDLISRHIRSILGQDFWASESDNVNGTDTLKYKHYTFLELFMTVSYIFFSIIFVNVSKNKLKSLKCTSYSLTFKIMNG